MKNWPAWFYGPDGQKAIFDSQAEVPEGWEDHPNKHLGGQGGGEEESVPPGRQPQDAVADDSFYDAMGEEELRAQLDAKGITYHPRAGKPKLISLLRTGKADKNKTPEA